MFIEIHKVKAYNELNDKIESMEEDIMQLIKENLDISPNLVLLDKIYERSDFEVREGMLYAPTEEFRYEFSIDKETNMELKKSLLGILKKRILFLYKERNELLKS